MAYQILMPRLGWNMEEGTFVEWLKNDGDRINKGDLVCTIEGDKATSEVESFESGVLKIPPDAPQPGTSMPVETLLGYVVPESELVDFKFPSLDTPEKTEESVPIPNQEPVNWSWRSSFFFCQIKNPTRNGTKYP